MKIVKVVVISTIALYSIACSNSTSGNLPKNKAQIVEKDKIVNSYGKLGKHKVSYEYHSGTKIFFPSDISVDNPTPIVFFIPGYKLKKSKDYETLINFIASHGYTVVYAPDEAVLNAAKWYVDLVTNAVKESEVLPYVDTSRIGVIGHSVGGGSSFYVLDKLSKDENWGENGRFIFALDPFFPYGMSNKDLQNLPTNTNIIVQKYGFKKTDPRVALTTYYQLNSIADRQKDYQVFEDVNHYYPANIDENNNVLDKSIFQLQYVLKPLDALMAYTFEGKEDARKIALEIGNDDPIANNSEEIKSRDSYKYKCSSVDGDRFCKILP